MLSVAYMQNSVDKFLRISSCHLDGCLRTFLEDSLFLAFRIFGHECMIMAVGFFFLPMHNHHQCGERESKMERTGPQQMFRICMHLYIHILGTYVPETLLEAMTVPWPFCMVPETHCSLSQMISTYHAEFVRLVFSFHDSDVDISLL